MFRTDALCVHLGLPQKKLKRKRYLTCSKSRLSHEVISSDALSVNTVPNEEVTTSDNVLTMNVDDCSVSLMCQISGISLVAICDNLRPGVYSLHGTKHLPVSDSFKCCNAQYVMSDTSGCINGASD
jgi:hypothetical protein